MLPGACLRADREVHPQPPRLPGVPALGLHSFRDRNTIATALKGSGYATVYLGKYLNGYGYMPKPGQDSGNSLSYKPPGWTMWARLDRCRTAGERPEAGRHLSLLRHQAGVSMSRKVDGVSMLGIARHGDKGWSRAILTETGKEFGRVRKTDIPGGPHGKGEQADIRFAIGVRTERYLYVNIATGERELYDLAKDPRQYKNVAKNRGYADVVALLRRELHRMRACTGNACSNPMAPELTTGP